jgi:hypothetical protein
MHDRIVIFFVTMLLYTVAWGQAQNASNPAPVDGQQSMPGMDMSASKGEHDMSNTNMPMAPDKGNDSDASAHAMHSMEGHMDMGPHMKMTALRPSKPGDADRAQQIVDAARKASEKYKDFHAALADGYKIFLPNIPQQMYHFTNYGYAMEAAFRFNPEHPTSLLYEKHGDNYRLVGVMYTAPKRFREDQLDQRIPLSVAQWHEHVNFCAPPPDHKKEILAPNPQFGLQGSITTREACEAAGGTFQPVIFNWMVHVYPFEKDVASIWSVERQHAD